MLRKTLRAVLATALVLGVAAAPAGAKPAPVTKIKFKLDSHVVGAGSDLTGWVRVWTRNGNAWDPFAGATLTVLVDGVEVGTVTSGADGYVDVVYPATVGEGDHVMKVVFPGDDAHKRAQRAQGFTVIAGAPVAATVPDAPVLSATPGTGVVSLSWTVPADGGSPITGYNVYRGDTSGGETLLVPLGPVTSYDDTTVTSGTAYFYVVTAVNAVGESAWSNEFMVTPA